MLKRGKAATVADEDRDPAPGPDPGPGATAGAEAGVGAGAKAAPGVDLQEELRRKRIRTAAFRERIVPTA